MKIKKEILQLNDIKKSTRILGYLLIPFAITGNFFMAIAGFTLIKKEKKHRIYFMYLCYFNVIYNYAYISTKFI